MKHREGATAPHHHLEKGGELKLQPKQRSRSELLWHFALLDEVQLAKIAVVIFLSSQRVILKVPEK